ncbi:uncharacterized protein LOC113872966 isoform X2 [Abrus precatorius]|uniref:Uncharacterized protein LOC113872966 isoform X2 n=1 Tax=Abrus precatorius TaxID=3816 RepID=A0A8B8MDB6_ABRPR|nr:uncharacterized protein LOC113872966 isoform X2 [Abrus precatorius]
MDSMRRHSDKLDRERSPKRYRRDVKEENRGGGGHHNHMNHHEPRKHSSQPPRSRSYYQGITGQLDQSRGRRDVGGKVFTQSKENNERVEKSQSREQRDEKSQGKLDDNFRRRNGFTERKDDPPPTVRKRPAFREKKIPMDSGDANPAPTVAVKSSHTDYPQERNESKEERSSNPHHLDKPEGQNADDRALNKSEVRRDGFSSRAIRHGGSGANNNYRGRDKFNRRQGYRPITTRTEKWKHDLYQEVNKDPISKNEDEQIAKLEALLAS